MSNVSYAEKLKAAKTYLASKNISAVSARSEFIYTGADGRTHAPTRGQRIATKEEVHGRLRTPVRQDHLQQLRAGDGRVSSTPDMSKGQRYSYRNFTYRY